jgi:hypothetical protein
MLTAVGSGLQRVARNSNEYVGEIQKAMKRMGGRKLSQREKQVKLSHILADHQNGMIRLGQSMIGPIQLQLRYQGILRNVLLEDTLTPGVPIQYDILDDLGQAYIMHGDEGEIKITPFEGKRVVLNLFRIASFPMIKKEDLYYLRANIVEYTQDYTKQAIMRQEDSRLITLLEVAAANYRAIDGSAVPGVGALPNEITVAGSSLQPTDLYTAVTYTDQRLLDSSRLLVNPPGIPGLLQVGHQHHGLGLQGLRRRGREGRPVRRVPDRQVDHHPGGYHVPDPGAAVPGRLPGDVLARCRGEQPGGAVPQGLGHGRTGGDGCAEPQGHYDPEKELSSR